jgi:hypothetical protein
VTDVKANFDTNPMFRGYADGPFDHGCRMDACVGRWEKKHNTLKSEE